MERRAGGPVQVAAVTFVRMNSTRFPGKCLVEFRGKPLIQHTIDLAKKVGWPLYVWTRHEALLDYVSDKCAVIWEPAHLLDTPHNSTLEKLEVVNRVVCADYLVLLQATHPLRSADTVRIWCARVREAHASYGRSVTRDDQGKLVDSGSFYAYSRQYILTHKMSGAPLSFEEDPPVDVHTAEDIKRWEK